MNNVFVSGNEVALVANALDALHDSTGIQGEILDHLNNDADATILLTINGRELQYDCEVKKKVDRYALPLDLLNRLGNTQRTLLVSSPLSPDMANHCRDRLIVHMTRSAGVESDTADKLLNQFELGLRMTTL